MERKSLSFEMSTGAEFFIIAIENGAEKPSASQRRQTKRRKSTKKDIPVSDGEEEVIVKQKSKKAATVTKGAGGRTSARTRGKKVTYAEEESE